MQKLFPIICCVLILVGGAGSLMYFSSASTDSEVTTTYSVEQLEDEVKEVASQLLLLKHHKQWCKDGLNEYQTIAEYKGIQFFCNERDAEIEQLKNRLAAMLTMPYEQLDANLNEAKQDKDIEHLSGVVATGSGSLQALMDFLQAE